jgi:hypothetical protein
MHPVASRWPQLVRLRTVTASAKAFTGTFPKEHKMNLSLSMKTLALIALVVASTVAIVQIEPSATVEMTLAQNIH